MAVPSENTYGQRLARGTKLLDRVKSEAAYNPKKNNLITLGALEALLGEIRTANTQVGEKAQAYNQAQDDRRPLYYGTEGLRKRVAMARDVIGGYEGGKQTTAYQTLRRIAQDMRNYQKPKNDPLPVAGQPAAGKTGPSQAQMSFGSLLQLGRDAVATLRAMGTDYETDNALVTVAALDEFIAQLEGQDTLVNTTLDALKKQLRTRLALYEDPAKGLQARMAEVKSYVAGTFQKSSQLYKDLVKIKY